MQRFWIILGCVLTTGVTLHPEAARCDGDLLPPPTVRPPANVDPPKISPPAQTPAPAPAPTAVAAVTAPAPTTAPAATQEAPKGILAVVMLRTLGALTIRGNVAGFDDKTVTLQTAKGPVTHQWSELTTPSACTLRARLIDKTKGTDWLALARLAWGMGNTDQARTAVTQALALDRSLKPLTDALLKSPAGTLLKLPADPPAEARAPDRTPAGPTPSNIDLFPEVPGRKPR